MIGTTVSQYKIVGRLGKGGMAEVFVAQDPRLQREVALKILPADMASDPERRSRFEREAQAIAALNHPNIVTIYSVEEVDGVHFMTMELVRGKCLTEYIVEDGVPLKDFFKYAIPLTEAVASAHEQGITHRDLKPDNIMIGADGRLKVLDFGLAKIRPMLGDADPDSDTQMPTVTQEGTIMGTVSYMSPEQSEGKAIDPRSDIFSLGVIFYEMATGQRPFQGDTSMSIISSILKDDPRSVEEIKGDVPPNLGKLILKCLKKEVDQRFQSTRELREELEGSQLEMSSPSIQGTIVAGDQGDKKLKVPMIAAAAAAGVVVVGALAFFGLRDGSDSANLDAAPPEPEIEAVEAIESESRPEDAEGIKRAEAYAELGMMPEAIGAYRDLLGDPDEELVAEAQRRLELLEDASRPDFERLKEVGRTAFHRGDLEASIEAFKRAVQLFPQDSMANYLLARSLTGADFTSEAIDAMEVAVAGQSVSTEWFDDQSFYPLYRQPRFVYLVATVVGDHMAASLQERAELELARMETENRELGLPETRTADAGRSEPLSSIVDREPVRRSSPPAARPVPRAQTPVATAPRLPQAGASRVEVGPDDVRIDTETRIMWGRPSSYADWKDAEAYALSYGRGGYNDWRLPTASELQNVCAAVRNDPDERLPRFLWTSERKGPPIARVRKTTVWDCRDNRPEGDFNPPEVKRMLDTRQGMAIYSLPVR